MKDGYEATKVVIEALRKLGVPHMVVGGLSSNAYGIPRSTKDADIVLAVDPRFLLRVPSIAFGVELFMLSFDPHDQARFKRLRPPHI